MEPTPAQTQFLTKNISGFDASQWVFSSAGHAGSDRRFLRFQKGKESYILILWDSRDEDWPRFLTIEKELRDAVPFLPHVYAFDTRHGLILEEDLGGLTLKAACEQPMAAIEELYRRVIDALVSWQRIDMSVSTVIGARAMDEDVFLWESSYFALHCVTEYFGCETLLGAHWERERSDIAREAAVLPHVYIHRDFQSENILLHKSAVRFVDFQGARIGPAGYDLASLLMDPYIAVLDTALTMRLFDYYQSKTDRPLASEALYICAAQRLMQALGAYGNLSLHKGKERYKQFIPIAINRCISIVEKLPQYPRLLEILYTCKGK